MNEVPMTEDRKQRITQMLLELGEQGLERRVPEDLLAEVYADLERLAGEYLRRERGGHTLEPAALVNEAYLRLVRGETVDWQGRTHFFAVGARAMRNCLIDQARRKHRLKRGGDRLRVTFADDLAWPKKQLEGVDVLAVHEALNKLRDLDERQAKIVEWRCFGGLTSREVADALGVSVRTVDGHWAHARAWLLRELEASRRHA